MGTTQKNGHKLIEKFSAAAEWVFKVSFFCMILSYLTSMVAVSFLDQSAARIFCDMAVYLFSGVFILSGCVASRHW